MTLSITRTAGAVAGGMCLLASSYGCGRTPMEPWEETEQVFLFEVEYASSWLPTWTGISIDTSGTITAYYREEDPFVPATEDRVTEAELREKYAANATVVGQLDRSVLETRYQQIAEVGHRFTEPDAVCADAGVQTYTAFRFDVTTREYLPVRLRVEGDFPTQNVAGSAPELSEWLRAVLRGYPVDGLEPFTACVP